MKKNEILVTYGTDYVNMTEELLREAGLAELIGDRNRRIGIKPNLVAPVLAAEGGTTHPEVVEGLIRYLQANGFQDLTIMEGSWVGDKTEESFEVCGYNELAEKYQVKLIDATPIGINVRSTAATYANVHDELRKVFAKTAAAKNMGYKAGDFSYNTGKLRCPVCDGTGQVSLDVQFLPDVDIPCPECRGSRYSKEASLIKYTNKKGQSVSLPELMDMDIHTALEACDDLKLVKQRLTVLKELGLGYLTLGEETPSLSGGEAQRLKLASEMGKLQNDSLFIFDEPTIGLHPLDVQTLLKVFQTLIENGATVVVIEHDLDVIRNADYIIDMGPGGGADGGRIVACETPEQLAKDPNSQTGRYL